MLELIALALVTVVLCIPVAITFYANYKMIQSWENEAREIEKRLWGES